MSISWAYIFHAPGADPATDRFVLDKEGVKATIVGAPDHDAAAKVADELVKDGVKAIELCGAFGVNGLVRVREEVKDRAAVSGVSFSVEAMPLLAKAFSGGPDLH